MKRILAGITAIMLCAPAFATESRNSAMGADYWRIGDDTNVTLFPSEVVNYSKVLYGELGGTSGSGDDYAGIHVPLGPGVFGFYAGALAAPDDANILFSGLPLNTTQFSGAEFQYIPVQNVDNAALYTAGTPVGRVKALYGMTVGTSINLGVGINWLNTVDHNYADTNPWGTVYEDGSVCSQIGFEVGASVPFGIVDPLAFGVSIGLPSFDSWSRTKMGSYTDEMAYKSTGGSTIDVNVRARLKELIGKGTATYVFGRFAMGSLNGKSSVTELKDSGGNPLVDKKDMKVGGWTFGVANNHRMGDNSLVVWSVAVNGDSSGMDVTTMDPATDKSATTFSVSSSTLSIPITLALETRLFSWLVARLSSASNVINSTTNECTIKGVNEDKRDGKLVTDTSSQSFALGVTFNVTDKFDIDGTLAESLLFNGPYLVGGVANTGLLGQVSMIYRF